MEWDSVPNMSFICVTALSQISPSVRQSDFSGTEGNGFSLTFPPQDLIEQKFLSLDEILIFRL